MFIGLCGSILAGKQSVAAYLVEQQNFSMLHLAHVESSTSFASSSLTTNHTSPYNTAENSDNKVFGKIEEMVDFVTKRWQQRWVTTDIQNEIVLETLLRRPFFLLVSVDAPLSLRWQRSVAR